MALPTLLVRYSTDDADDPTPSWTDITDDVRSFSVSRGRDSELSEMGPGTATLVLNNRNGDWDPVNDATLRPMNRVSIQGVLSASTQDVFLGYVESIDQQWPATGKDAITVMSLVDEFKVLAQDALPATDPPRESYQELCMFDEPRWYLPMGDVATGFSVTAAVGESMTAVNSFGSVTGIGAILGQELPGYNSLTTTSYLRTQPIGAGHELDPGGLIEFAIEAWISADIDSTPAAAESLMRGPTAGASTWSLELNTNGTISCNARNSGGTVHTVTSTTALAATGVFLHVVATITGGSLRIYINGTQEASTAWTGAFAAVTTASVVTIGNNGASIGSVNRNFDEVAFYRRGLTAARVTAHYEAGTVRGLVRNTNPDNRITDILDASSSIAARNIRNSTQGHMLGSYMAGQSPLDEIRKAERVAGPNGVFFIAKDGTITFYDENYRHASLGFSLGNTVQATFDDDGTDHKYQDIDLDYSDSFIANKWDVTRTGGTTVSMSDATSISRYGTRAQAITDLPVNEDTTAPVLATALLAKYKDPMTRITSLSVLTHPNATAEALLPLELGSKIRVFRTPMGGGSRIDQSLWIQKIDVQGEPGKPWRYRLGVSPL